MTALNFFPSDPSLSINFKNNFKKLKEEFKKTINIEEKINSFISVHKMDFSLIEKARIFKLTDLMKKLNIDNGRIQEVYDHAKITFDDIQQRFSDSKNVKKRQATEPPGFNLEPPKKINKSDDSFVTIVDEKYIIECMDNYRYDELKKIDLGFMDTAILLNKVYYAVRESNDKILNEAINLHPDYLETLRLEAYVPIVLPIMINKCTNLTSLKLEGFHFENNCLINSTSLTYLSILDCEGKLNIEKPENLLHLKVNPFIGNDQELRIYSGLKSLKIHSQTEFLDLNNISNKLESLTFINTSVDYKILETFTNLKSLSILHDENFGDEQLALLPRQLISFSIATKKLKAWSSLPIGLTSLNVYYSKTDDEMTVEKYDMDYLQLRTLTNLQTLGIDLMGGCYYPILPPNLTKLSLNNLYSVPSYENVFQICSRLKNLSDLTLRNSRVAGINCTQLKKLTLFDCVTSSLIIKRTNPEESCQINIDGDWLKLN